MIESLIAAGGSLLGGLLGKEAPTARQNARGHVRGIMEASEKFKINPLTLLGSVGAVGGGASQNYMGAAISDAAMILADGMTAQKEAGKLNQLEQANAQLKTRLTQQTLRPKVGGIYAANQTTPTMQEALNVDVPSGPAALRGAGDAGGDPYGDPRLRPLPETSVLDPRRGVDHQDVMSGAGFFMVDSPHLPFSIPVATLDGSEPLSFGDYPTVGLGVGLGYALDKLPAKIGPARDDQPFIDAERKKRAKGWKPSDRYNNHQGRQRPYPSWLRP